MLKAWLHVPEGEQCARDPQSLGGSGGGHPEGYL
jgi:hypothetical protein